MTLAKTILATLAYHDIFDYPLTTEEIHNYLIGKKATLKSIDTELSRLVAARAVILSAAKNLYALTGRGKIFQIRQVRIKYSQEKLKKAQLFANILRLIPTVKLVAISGALAMQNSHRKDDIDLVIICSKNTLWTTRFLANLILAPFKRYPKSSLISNRACLNIFIDQSDLGIRPHHLYLAHEICQMKLLWDRDGTYSRFIKANRWTRKFLPNWAPSSEFIVHRLQKKKLPTMNYPLKTAESVLRRFQLWYMRPKITTEKIGEYQLFFHPAKTGEWVMREYQKRLKNLGIKTKVMI